VAFDVISLDGSAKVQRASKKEYEKVSIGSQVHDNDILETYFQAKLVMQFGKGNVAILGSNSKALVNIREQKGDNGASTLEVNLTLFGGGCFVKAISGCKISVYTSNGVGETESGSFSTVVESKTGETGFQTLGGTIKTRNIAQKEGSNLTSGQTTMILPGKEPTAPLYITVRHVTVLKHFFGDEYIENELSVSGIKPTEEKTGGQGSAESGSSQQSGVFSNMGGYKRQFEEDRLWGSVISDRQQNALAFDAISAPDVSKERTIVVSETNLFAMAMGHMYPSFTITPSYTSKIFGAGLRIPIAANWTGQLSLYDFSSVPGFLDLIDHVTLGPFFDSTFVKLGPIQNYSIGDGLVVDGYNNYNPYLIFHPLGAVVQAKIGDVGIQGFLGDLSAMSPGGVYLAWDPGTFRIGAGYFFDGDMNYLKNIDSAGTAFRFVNLPRADSSSVAFDSTATVAIYQLDFTANVITDYDYRILLGAGFAQKLGAKGSDGYVLRVPNVELWWDAICLKANLTTEAGRLVEGEFNSFYMSNRIRVIDTAGLPALPDTVYTQNSILSTKRIGTKIELYFGINPLKGTSLGLTYKQNLYENHPTIIDTSFADPDLTIGISFSVNDSLWQPIKYGSINFGETHGGMYPRNTPFPSWGFHFGLDVVSNPILFGVGVAGGLSVYYLDMNSNGAIDALDNVFEFYLGLRYGFL